MKKISLTAIAIIITTICIAQVKLNFAILNTQPPAQLSEWGNRREVLTLMATGQPGAPGGGQFKIKTEIKTLDGTVIGNADLARTPVFTINSTGTPTILFANDAMPLEFMVFTGKYKTSLERTGKLPAGNYIICVRPVNIIDYTPLGEEQCKTFYLASTQLPILMKPYNEEVLDAKKAQTAIIFRWSPVVPTQPSPVTYRIQVFEVLPTQSPVQALRSNQPLLDKEIVAATQFIWQPQLSFLPYDGETKKLPTFVWTIQSLDVNHNPVTQTDGNGEGRSEPLIFFVNPDKNKKPAKEN
ncbi:MAG: hypothetical protein IPO01_05270 [Chitinophagaceae bacterium]|nr:hypothetical protein [Chitinophagaceae bacterium]MBL0199217.1 hypothetical protein [Chitinophagaceae bacterium]